MLWYSGCNFSSGGPVGVSSDDGKRLDGTNLILWRKDYL